MKKAIISLLFFLPLVLIAQNETAPQTPYIEVTGTAEKSIVPDEIYIAINLTERYNGKNKVSIEKQEKKLKEALIDDGIYLANLTVADAEANYVKVKWGKKDVINEKEFFRYLSHSNIDHHRGLHTNEPGWGILFGGG